MESYVQHVEKLGHKRRLVKPECLLNRLPKHGKHPCIRQDIRTESPVEARRIYKVENRIRHFLRDEKKLPGSAHIRLFINLHQHFTASEENKANERKTHFRDGRNLHETHRGEFLHEKLHTGKVRALVPITGLNLFYRHRPFLSCVQSILLRYVPAPLCNSAQDSRK